MLTPLIVLGAASVAAATAVALTGFSPLALAVTAVSFFAAGMMATINGANNLLKSKGMTNDKFAEFFDLDK